MKLRRITFADARGTTVNRDRLGEPAVRRSLFRVLDATDLCSIATVSGAGRPHINTAHFCYSDDLVLYFLSHPTARHCLNLRRASAVAVTVFSSAQRWGRPGRGVQLFGSCRPVSGEQAREAARLYARRFPAYRQWRAAAGRGSAGDEYRFYRVLVRRVKLMDERAIGDGLFATGRVQR